MMKIYCDLWEFCFIGENLQLWSFDAGMIDNLFLNTVASFHLYSRFSQ